MRRDSFSTPALCDTVAEAFKAVYHVNQLVLWFNMIGFTLMFASVGLSYLIYDRNRAIWLRDYLIYAAAYTVWLLFATWVFFRAVYLTDPLPLLTSIFARARSIVSILIVVFGPLFFFRCGGYAIKGPVLAVIVSVATAITGAIAVLLIAPNQTLGYIVTPLFNLYLSVLASISFAAVRKRPRAVQRPMMPLLLYSVIAYAMLSLFGVFLPMLTTPEQGLFIHAIGAGTFLSGWAVLMIVVNMRWISRRSAPGTATPYAFLSDYGVTKREAEVVELLLTGMTSAQIAQQLFVSHRTVETHLYNVYGKCDVANRIELVAKIAAYRAGANS